MEDVVPLGPNLRNSNHKEVTSRWGYPVTATHVNESQRSSCRRCERRW